MSATLRGVLIGGLLGLLVLGLGAALLIAGIVEVPTFEPPTDRLLVISTAPDDVSVNAPFAFVIDQGAETVTLLDPTVPAVISGTSATNARDAYAFVGGSGVASALAPQTDGDALQWLVLPPAAWSRIVDEAGGVEVEVPWSISVYRDGELYVLDSGTRRLSGEQAVALASAASYLEDEAVRRDVEHQLGTSISAVIAVAPQRLAELVAEGSAYSSLRAEQVSAIVGESP